MVIRNIMVSAEISRLVCLPDVANRTDVESRVVPVGILVIHSAVIIMSARAKGSVQAARV
jgi:hypothetical protein